MSDAVSLIDLVCSLRSQENSQTDIQLVPQ